MNTQYPFLCTGPLQLPGRFRLLTLLLLLGSLLLTTQLSLAQTAAGWARRIGGPSYELGEAMTVDGSGNVYITGNFQGTLDFDPGTGVTELTSAGSDDVYVCKFTASGNLVWARAMGGAGSESAFGVAVDGSGNVYTTGGFFNTADFDPSPTGVASLTSVRFQDIFVSKLDANGNYVWAKSMGGRDGDAGRNIAVSNSGDVYIVGDFEYAVDFDPDPTGVASLTETGSGGDGDIFVCKLEADGDFVWVKQMGGPGNGDQGFGITVDANGNIYTTGYFQGTADFDPNPTGVTNLTAVGRRDIFVSKLDANGDYVWARQMGGPNRETGNRIAIDGLGNVYITGDFEETVDFDPGPDVANLTAASSQDIFVCKLNASGNYAWAKAMGGTSGGSGRDIAVDGSGNVYVTGDFRETVDFDPGAGVAEFVSAGDGDLYLSKLDASGDYVWTRQIGSTGSDGATAIAVTATNIYLTGSFQGTVDFDPGVGTTNLTSATPDLNDIFVLKLGITDGTICGGTSVSITATPSLSITAGSSVTLTASGADSYTWSTGESTTAITVSSVTSATAFSVTGVTGGCSGTASAEVTVAVGPCAVYVPQSITITNCSFAQGVYAPNGLWNGTQQWRTGNKYIRWSGTRWEILSGTFAFRANSTGSATDLPCSTGWEDIVGFCGGADVPLAGGCGPIGPLPIQLTATPLPTFIQGNSVTLTASSATSYTYTWVASSGGSPVNSASLVTNTTDTYSVTGLSPTGCFRTASITTNTITCGSTLHVTQNGDGNQDGSSWANAMPGIRLAPALAAACSGTTFLVGSGLYKPTTDATDQTASFSIASGVEVYGGYTVENGVAIGRIISTSTGTPSSTTFSGDIDNNNLLDGGNSYRVVWMNNVSASTRLDGLVITGGNGSSSLFTSNGGGIYNAASGQGISSNPTIINCLIVQNKASNGGGLYNLAQNGATANPVITNSMFLSNTLATGSGGAIQLEAYGSETQKSTASPVITNTVFRQNRADGFGGVIDANNQDGSTKFGFGDINPILTNCVLTSNTARAGGGCVRLRTRNGTMNLTAINCLFTDNSGGCVNIDTDNAFEGGEGPAFANIASPVFQSCTFTGNRRENAGGVLSINSQYRGVSESTITNCLFSNNSSRQGSGGVVYINGSDGTGSLLVTGSVFSQNRADNGVGGVFYTSSASLTLTSTTLTQNSALSGNNRGGAVLFNGSLLVLTNSTIENNWANNRGGGIAGEWSSTLVATDSRIIANQSRNQGGGVWFGGEMNENLLDANRATLTRVLISQNTATGSSAAGGGLANTDALSATFESCTIAQNINTGGGSGVSNQGANATFVFANTLFDRNDGTTSTDQQGGGAFGATNGNGLVADFTSCTFTGNKNANGGAIGMPASSTLLVRNSYLSGNQATDKGGAIFTDGASNLVINTNLNRNTAQTGGAISISAATSLTLVNATLNRNEAQTGGTVFGGESGGNLLVQNSIIWNNSPVANNFSGLAPANITLQNSLIDPASTTYTDGGNNKTVDPLFTNEAANNLTLTGCSPAVNTGDNALYTAAGGPATDVGGLTRPFNTTVDMGAYEFQGQPGVLSVSITATPSLTITSGGSVTLTASGATSYTWSNGSTDNPLVLTNVTSATTLSVTGVTGQCSATASAAVSVTVCSLTASISSANLTICNGQSTTLTASAGDSFRWSTAETSSAIVVAPTSITAYQLTVTTGACSATTTATVTVNPAITASIGGNQVLGCGQSLTLTAQGGTGFTWSANVGGGTDATVVLRPAQTGTVYSVTLTNPGTGCSGVASVTATLAPSLAAQAISSTAVSTLSASNCPVMIQSVGTGNAFVFTNPVTGFTYSTVYRRGGTYSLPAFPVKQPGTYTMTAYYTDACGATSTDTRTFVVTGTGCN